MTASDDGPRCPPSAETPVSLHTFFSVALGHPRVVGAIAPSSSWLAAEMIRRADPQPGQLVVELGSGTGPMTRALVTAGPGLPRFAVEPVATLAAATRRAAPGVEVVEGSAEHLPAMLADRGLGPIDRIVSSLPFAAWPADLQDRVLAGITAALAPRGRMVTFTYAVSPLLPAGRRFRQRLTESFAHVTATPIVWANLPPAFVYVCEGVALPQP